MKKKSLSKVIALVMSVCCVLTAIPIVANAWPNDEWKKEASWNGDFEVGYEGMEVYGWKLVPFKNSLTLETDASKASYATTNHTLKTAVENGNKVAQLNRVGGGYAAMASQTIEVTGGQGYQISLDYKTIEVTAVGTNNQAFSGINLVVQQFNENGEETWQHWTIDEKGYGQTVSSEWSSLNQILLMESDTISAVVYIAIRGEWNSRAKVLLDNVKVQECDANNVLNGDFETSQDAEGIDGWKLLPCGTEGRGDQNQNQTSYPNNYIISKVTTEEDNSYMKLAPKDIANGYVVAQSSYIPIQPNQTYTLSYDLKAKGSQEENGHKAYNPKVRIYYYDNNKTYLTNTATNKVHTYEELVDWKSFLCEYTAPADAAYMTVNVYIGGVTSNNATPEHYIDNVNVLLDAYTQIFNGDGEYALSDGTVPGWSMTSTKNSYAMPDTNNYDQYYTITQVPGVGVAGSGAIKVTKTYQYGHAALTSTKVNITPGKSYELSYTYKITDFQKQSDTSIIYAICPLVYQYDVNGNQVGDPLRLGPKAGTTTSEITEWTQFSNYFTAQDGVAYCVIYIGTGGSSGKTGFAAWFDDIKLYEKPEWAEESTNYEGTSSSSSDYSANYDIVYTSMDNRTDVLKLYVTRADGCLGAVTYFSEKISVTGNTAYTTSYDLKIEGRDDNTTKPGAVYVIRYLDSNGEVCGTERINTSGTSPISNQDWTTYSKQITTPESAVSAQIGLLIGSVTRNISKNMAYYYDNLLLEKTEMLEKGANYLLFEGGDIDGNIGVDVRDIVQWKELEANKESEEFKKDADMNKNEKYDSDDQTLLMWKLLGKY